MTHRIRSRTCIALAILAAALALTAGAGRAAVGAGKMVVSIVPCAADAMTGICTPAPGSKAMGVFQALPKDTKPGGPPIARVVKMRFAKPPVGLAPGRYVVDLQAPLSAGAPVTLQIFATFTIDAAGKCTVDPHSSVLPPDGGLPGPGGCGEAGEPLCDGPRIGRCEFTAYQLAGVVNYSVGLVDGKQGQVNARIRELHADHDVGGAGPLCATGHVDVDGGDNDPACVGSGASKNHVVAIVGTTYGDVQNP